MSKSVLYISYDGMLEPLGQSQVLAYLKGLAEKHSFVLISFEKSSDWGEPEQRRRLQAQLHEIGIRWIPLRYHNRPSAIATAYDLAQGLIVGIWVTWHHNIHIVHARSYVPSVIALALKKLIHLKFIFDMRGFWADERVDGGLWKDSSQLYRIAKWFEKKFLLNADCTVSLTRAAVDEISDFSYMREHNPRLEIISTCTDLGKFRLAHPNSTKSAAKRRFTLGYVGSVGTWYLFDEVLNFFKVLQTIVPGAKLQILNRGDHNYISERIKAINIDPSFVSVEAQDSSGVAEAMRTMDAGVFFIKPAYSKIASSPTKMGEFLASGVPCLSNTGVGDVEATLGDNKSGVAINGFTHEELKQGAIKLLQLVNDPGCPQRCRETAEKYFSLQEGVSAYDRIYQSL